MDPRLPPSAEVPTLTGSGEVPSAEIAWEPTPASGEEGVLKEAAELIKKHEGLRLKPYRDTEGYLTIGYGHNLHGGITREQAELLLQTDLHRALEDLKSIFPKEWDRFPKEVKVALLDMMFNLGKSRFLGFKRMIEGLRRGDYSTAAKEMRNSLWCRQVKGRCEELAQLVEGADPNRRLASREGHSPGTG